METPNETPTAGAEILPVMNKAKRSTKKSTWWKRGPNLVQHVPTGTFYARVKVRGKSFRVSLNTDVFTTAKLRLHDKRKELLKCRTESGTFGDGRTKYEAETQNGYTNKRMQFVKLAPLSIEYRLRCLENLQRSLSESLKFIKGDWKDASDAERKAALEKLDGMKASDIDETACKAWQTHYSCYAPTFYNNTLNTLRRVLELAGVSHDENYAYKIGRMTIVETSLELPTPEQFDRIIALVETSGAAQARDCADLIRFLAFTGARISEAKMARWNDVDWKAQILRIHSVKVRGAHNGEVTRVLPFNPALKQLLERLHAEQKPEPTDRICVLSECQGALTRACKLVGCKRLTHHDMRHYFVTKCIQAGVDVLTLANWVGHRDNGKLLLKVYAQLQTEHSKKMAAKVTFGVATPENVLPLSQAAAS